MLCQKNWLGKYAYSDEVKSSGLWQMDYVFDKRHDLISDLLNLFEKQVQLTIKFFDDKNNS